LGRVVDSIKTKDPNDLELGIEMTKGRQTALDPTDNSTTRMRRRRRRPDVDGKGRKRSGSFEET